MAFGPAVIDCELAKGVRGGAALPISSALSNAPTDAVTRLKAADAYVSTARFCDPTHTG
jgi:hypothetical protein